MESIIDVLIYIIIISAAATVFGCLACAIHRMYRRIQRVNTRLIWRIVCRHRHA
jgi:hypothetical protein